MACSAATPSPTRDDRELRPQRREVIGSSSASSGSSSAIKAVSARIAVAISYAHSYSRGTSVRLDA
jgi:hypothetical protein